MLAILEKIMDVLQNDAERSVPRLDLIIITAMTTAAIIVPCIQYFIR